MDFIADEKEKLCKCITMTLSSSTECIYCVIYAYVFNFLINDNLKNISVKV